MFSSIYLINHKFATLNTPPWRNTLLVFEFKTSFKTEICVSMKGGEFVFCPKNENIFFRPVFSCCLWVVNLCMKGGEFATTFPPLSSPLPLINKLIQSSFWGLRSNLTLSNVFNFWLILDNDVWPFYSSSFIIGLKSSKEKMHCFWYFANLCKYDSLLVWAFVRGCSHCMKGENIANPHKPSLKVTNWNRHFLVKFLHRYLMMII